MGFFTKRTKEERNFENYFIDTILNSEYISLRDILDENVLTNSDIFTAIRIISSDIAGLNLLQNDSKEASTDEDLNFLLNIKPNGQQTPFSFKFSLIANVFLTGNSYARIIRDKNRKPIELRLMKSSLVIPKVEKGVLFYEFNNDEKIKKEDVLHFKFFSIDGINGISPLHSLAKEVEMLESGNSALLSFFKNGVKGSGILKVKNSNLNSEAKQKIREKFEEANAGNNNALKTIILDDSMEYTSIEVNTKILEMVNNNKYSTKQIAKAFGISSDRFGQETPNTSINDSNAIYLHNTLKSYLIPVEQEISLKLIDYPFTKTRSFSFDTTSLFRQTEKEQYENISKGIQNSVLTINEAREKLGLSPIEGGDRLLQSLNFKDAIEEGEDNSQNG